MIRTATTLLAFVIGGSNASLANEIDLQISPIAILLETPEASQQLRVTGFSADGHPIDLTRLVTIDISDSAIAGVDKKGLISALSDIWGQL